MVCSPNSKSCKKQRKASQKLPELAPVFHTSAAEKRADSSWSPVNIREGTRNSCGDGMTRGVVVSFCCSFGRLGKIKVKAQLLLLTTVTVNSEKNATCDTEVALTVWIMCHGADASSSPVSPELRLL